MPPQSKRAIAHLNIIGFRAAVAALVDPSLRERTFIIAGGTGGRTVAWDVSPAALKEGIKPGMALAAAERIIKNLEVIHPDPISYQRANSALEKIITRYAPAWQNDGYGNLYLDLTGTGKLFGPPRDCVCHIQNEIIDSLEIKAAAATATNKLVTKVASRAIRPLGLVDVRAGDEAVFLAHQDITLLPGFGASIMKTIRVTGFREAWELAALSDGEAAALFGKKGILLRDSALGIDNSPVAACESRVIESRADFPEDIIEETVIHGAIASIAGYAGLEMRKDKLGMTVLKIEVVYADGVNAEGKEKMSRPFFLDREITEIAKKVYHKTVLRRIRIRSVILSLEGLVPMRCEPELFEPETNRNLQEAVDSIQKRYGAGTLTRGIILAAGTVKRLSISAVR
jgi:DNA polymerase-4